jgi:uncharacterized protein
MTDNIPITNKDGLNQDPLQEALEAIHSNRLGLAHRLLLQAVHTKPQDIQIWLLLGWTAPTSASAAFYFHRLLEEHPDNPLARDILQEMSHKTESEVSRIGVSNSRAIKVNPKPIAPLERSEVQSQTSGDQTRLVERHMAARNAKMVESQPSSRKAKPVGILKSLRIPLVYLAALSLAEALTTLGKPQIGLILHGVLLITLILHATLFARHGLQKFLITLTLAPLIRLMSLSVPLIQFPFIYWYAVIGIPLLLAAFLVLRVTGFKADRIGLNMRALPWQLVVGLTGLIFGYLEYLILRPAPLEESLTWQQILLPALILLLFTGFLEEFIFRGLIQRGAYGTVGHYGLLYVAVLFAVLHLGYHSILDMIFVFVVALFFGLVVTRTGSILGVTLSHGLTNIALYLVIPFLMNPAANPIAAQTPTATDTATIPLVWLMPDSNARQMTLDDGGIEVTHLNTQWGLIEAKAYARPDLVHPEEKVTKTNEKWQPGYPDYGMCKIEDIPPLKLASTKSVRSPIWYRMVTAE